MKILAYLLTHTTLQPKKVKMMTTRHIAMLFAQLNVLWLPLLLSQKGSKSKSSKIKQTLDSWLLSNKNKHVQKDQREITNSHPITTIPELAKTPVTQMCRQPYADIIYQKKYLWGEKEAMKLIIKLCHGLNVKR